MYDFRIEAADKASLYAELIAAAGAWWAATLGGRHRDEQTVFARFGRWN